MFYTQFSRPDKKPEINSGEIITESVGYTSIRDQVRAMLYAGKMRQIARGYDTDVQPDIEQLRYDPTRRKNYDIVDAQADMAAVRARLEAAKAAAEEVARQAKEVEIAAKYATAQVVSG